MKEISIKKFKEIKIGNAEDREAATGCTVLISEPGVPVGLAVRGGGPASRESELLKPQAAAEAINAIVLAGGSAFGLDAAGGVMQYLEEHDIGLDVAVTKVPLVCQSGLFDLSVGSPRIRPDKAMGYQACENAQKNNYRDGNYGAGIGASVGKFKGMESCMKSGIGSYAVQLGDLKLGAIVVLNAFGDVYNYRTGQKIAGLLNKEKTAFADTEEAMYEDLSVVENKFIGNTSLAVVISNAKFDKGQLCKIASMAHNGYARSIRPLNTSVDGDSIYAMSVGSLEADQDMVGTLAGQVVSEAIIRAVDSAESAYGLPAARDLFK